MDYEQALGFINGRLRFGIKPGLERTACLLRLVGEPQRKLRFVHVAGTNGKGSVCTMIAAALRKAGHRTGLFTSPYITDFRERMQTDGEMIPEEDLARLTGYVAERMKMLPPENAEVTEFELITVTAMLWFAERECDYVVLETGLGGRLDSTNVIEPPECAVITRIDLDHTAVLGDTAEKIAAEKAGIIKPGCPVVLAPYQPEDAERVIARRALKLGCELIRPDTDSLEIVSASLDGTDIRYKGLDIHIPLLGAHQKANCVTAVEALRVLGVPDEKIVSGVAEAFIPARLELMSREPVVLLDGAHNPNGAAALASAIKELLSGRHTVGVTGMLADKDHGAETGLLAGLFDAVYCCDGFSERCLPAAQLAGEFDARGTAARAMPSPESALDAALGRAEKDSGAAVIFGSLYLAGALRPYIIEKLK